MPFLYRISSEDTAMARWELGKTPMLVGRGLDANIWIPDYRVSARHFQIRWEEGKHLLEDLNSTNGTWVNENRVTKVALRVGDRIQAGKTFFSYETGLATAIHDFENQFPESLA